MAILLLCAAPVMADWIPDVGEIVPNLRLPTIDGETKSLWDFRGKKTLLIQFASW